MDKEFFIKKCDKGFVVESSCGIRKPGTIGKQYAFSDYESASKFLEDEFCETNCSSCGCTK